MNLTTRYELKLFIENDLSQLLQSIRYKNDIEVCIQDNHICEIRIGRSITGEMQSMAVKVLNISEIRNIEYTTGIIFITHEDGTITHIDEYGASEAEMSFYQTVIAGGANSVI